MSSGKAILENLKIKTLDGPPGKEGMGVGREAFLGVVFLS
jgi:hypothetical protein